MERIYLASPHMSSEGYEQAFVQEAFDTNWIAPLGENVNQFEAELAEKVGIENATALVSGTSAIHLALKHVGVKPGDIVFCQSLTFSASANPIVYEGGKPVFIDSEPGSWNMDPKRLEEAFTKYQPKAVIAVHLYGLAAKIDEIKAICDEHGVPLIEDAAESLGTIYKGQYTGTFGDYGIYSFNGNKIITTSGGGMLVAHDAAITDKARFWATQARENERHYEHKEIGYNYRMSNIVAGIGRGQLKVLDERVAQKRHIFQRYQEAFQTIDDIQMITEFDNERSNYWLSAMLIDQESRVTPTMVMDALEKENIESRPIWKPMHLQPVFSDCDVIGGEVAEDLFNRGLCLPSDTKMTDEEITRIISIIKSLWS
ncbi:MULTISPECIES: DegT/DnrJ/EryC1/StrS aminotransferase family protein [Aerococcus]|uniref:Aminotransferase DegT n=1 Tax=Aerococcus sanguinicola TaxID=119206 RepID=A0A5N1GQ93_9LACT|nr:MULTISPECIES: DegT/DnrJ/EryC1/StrS family aminotransferase [Aerococcus]KAA9302221.1 aminotransferase DegT [Aerococcus sanguinicola]MDK6368350.1 DegT/DnrJ/EryC1/StrS family aminotransferase [Aerococcus sp. UMB9870]MDK6679432.1 DegT/DnrJ/EryC1/StrS family aminotransferase [Aerococcus sp. UMB8608]MDK6687197.1 DegT/DnrJ/EryC1/StrS family aminotransferase [Aerococcus sp. UMB8623]MDK6941104.1 DegT/DnrJ/EryC1/StrS family aminotransferase [Aerococcus sp. UMB8487]